MTSPDLPRLREALAKVEPFVDSAVEPWRTVYDAARAYAALLESGERVWWCEEHEYSGYEEACLYPWWFALESKLARTHSALAEARDSCRMVRVRLVPDPEEEK